MMFRTCAGGGGGSGGGAPDADGIALLLRHQLVVIALEDLKRCGGRDNHKGWPEP